MGFLLYTELIKQEKLIHRPWKQHQTAASLSSMNDEVVAV